MFVSHAQHHKHSYYVIRGTDRLAGFHDDEVERIALVARYHRKSEPKKGHPEFAALDEAAQREVTVLAGLLRVAIGLDRNHAARVEKVSVKEREGRLIVKASAVPGEDISLELYAASARTGLLDAALGVTTEIREA
jgi:exopolyphosphatase / guanosine-5'-triphosphate,3'-diphosphate pyrophosphatase